MMRKAIQRATGSSLRTSERASQILFTLARHRLALCFGMGMGLGCYSFRDDVGALTPDQNVHSWGA